jgi:hypothetical protein
MLNAHKRQLVSLTVFLQAHTEMKSRHAGGRTAKEALASARHRTFVLVFSAAVKVLATKTAARLR